MFCIARESLAYWLLSDAVLIGFALGLMIGAVLGKRIGRRAP